MVVVVPDDLIDYEVQRGADLFSEPLEALAFHKEVHLSLPRFEVRSRPPVINALRALGLDLATSTRADFTGLANLPNLRLGDLSHEATIAVDEVGTVAAAAAGAAIISDSAPKNPPVVVVDRPFLFAIVDDPTGAVLFQGRVVDPQ